MTPEERWEEGIPHHPKSIEVMEIIRKYDEHGNYEFGGDGDNGEDILYYLDIYFEGEERKQAEEFERTQERLDWLSFLEQAGVDNWQGIDYAIELRREQSVKEDPAVRELPKLDNS